MVVLPAPAPTIVILCVVSVRSRSPSAIDVNAYVPAARVMVSSSVVALAPTIASRRLPASPSATSGSGLNVESTIRLSSISMPTSRRKWRRRAERLDVRGDWAGRRCWANNRGVKRMGILLWREWDEGRTEVAEAREDRATSFRKWTSKPLCRGQFVGVQASACFRSLKAVLQRKNQTDCGTERTPRSAFCRTRQTRMRAPVSCCKRPPWTAFRLLARCENLDAMSSQAQLVWQPDHTLRFGPILEKSSRR